MFACWLALACGGDGPALLARAGFPGDATDRSGLAGAVEVAGKVYPLNRLGGMGSGLDHLGDGEYLMVSDRGPADGALPFPARMHRVRFAGDGPSAAVRLLATVVLRQADGKPYSGGLRDRPRLDGEALRIAGESVLIADEYGPDLLEFSLEGKYRRHLALPAKLRCPRPGNTIAEETPPKASFGRFPNRSLEGLARTSSGKVVGLMQGPLVQDHAVELPSGKPAGRCCRLVVLDSTGGPSREYVYRLEDPEHGCSELLALDETRFLVLERDNAGGAAAKAKRVFLIDLAGSTEVSRVEALPAAALPEGVRPVRKRLLLDLLDPAYGIAGPNCPAKFEGLSWGPPLPDGRRRLVVAVDNDYEADRRSEFFAFGVSAKALDP